MWWLLLRTYLADRMRTAKSQMIGGMVIWFNYFAIHVQNVDTHTSLQFDEKLQSGQIWWMHKHLGRFVVRNVFSSLERKLN